MRMRRIHISVTLLVILVLIKPLDCFAGAFTRKAAACCVKGKCLPRSSADECCKGTVPVGSQLLAPKAPDYSTPVLALMAADVRGPIPRLFIAFQINEAHSPPGSPPSSRLNLPLLI